MPQSGQRGLQVICTEWGGRWQNKARFGEPRIVWPEYIPRLPDLSLDQLDKVLVKYAARAGLGIDNFNPRILLLLPADYR